MRKSATWRFWIETGLAAVSLLALVLTLVWEDWIELLTGVDPDHHSGSLEMLIALGFAAVTIAFALLARRERQRLRRLSTAG
ncbi:hypothetical protein GCM10010168_73070 [Actinoplanes ianthinogenes]|uniref:ABC transporter permease n=1 Tax=Actinoplanes ianthinogenes TaxID=122358 RepID=A0ABM7LN45_9ACTN|nr:ABC transporter permease [Actinoplanes ianthinogenes]BCJ40705.1 hypothetical protein Aiant_13620 [Actinoplanes ianthinogenes]GGR43493.1 hypothetical protein GCM10010168_73070 [Actinoplanes ianthinogenes]